MTIEIIDVDIQMALLAFNNKDRFVSYCDSEHCPIAYALKRYGFKNAVVFFEKYILVNSWHGLSQDAQDFIKTWDDTKDPEAVKTWLNRPLELDQQVSL